jgi:hypothetical protein
MNAPKKIWYDDQECSAGPVQFNSDEMKYVRADLVDGLVEALEVAAYVFRVYQAHHEYKTHNEKAERNKSYAEQMEAALKAVEEE